MNEAKNKLTLWNPRVALLLSLIFTPAFGAYILSENAKSLNNLKELNFNRVWLYVQVSFLLLILFSVFLPKELDRIYGPLGLVILAMWTRRCALKQITMVKEICGDDYNKKSWGKPVLVSVAFLLIYIAIITFFVLLKK